MLRILDERELCDFECLAGGSFSPLASYMTQSEYESCLSSMTLNGRDVFPIPIVLPMKEAVEPGASVKLAHSTGTHLATILVQECWQPDLEKEWQAVFGTTDENHPYISYMKQAYSSSIYYVSGALTIENTALHNNYGKYRNSPAVCRATGPWIGFQTRNPLHRSHIELIKRAAATVPGGKVLLHPVEGVTQECDIPFPVRMKCYKEVLPALGNATLSILPLSMRMAGPREAVWHAVIRRNYGCSHFIVGRDHAGPSYKTKEGRSFYGALEAQELATKMAEQIGITIIPSEELVYCEDVGEYKPVSESAGHQVRQLSGTELRRRLSAGEPVPEWFSYPAVVESLSEFYSTKRGHCFYFVGLSGAGKSTLAESLKGVLEEDYPSRPVTILDADIIRTHLSKGLGFSREDRSMNVRRIGYVASEIVKHGGIVIVANIAPFEEDRAWNRKQISQYGDYIEFFVDTPLEICEARDTKGLYAAARTGAIKQFTGVSDPFEVPEHAIRIPHDTKENAISFVWNSVKGFFKA
jgi:sulfate adenylyltransferase